MNRIVPFSSRKLIIRNPPDDLGTKLDRLVHELLRAGEPEISVLGEGDDLQIDEVAELLTEFCKCANTSKLGLTNVSLTADVKRSLCNRPLADLSCSRLIVLDSFRLLRLRPDRYSF